MSHRIFLLAAGALCLAGAASPALSADGCATKGKSKAPSLGGLLSAARSVGISDVGLPPIAGKIIDKAGEASEAKPDCPAADAQPETLTPVKKKPKAPKPNLYPGRIAVSEDIKAQKTAFDEFGKVRCSDCEGGYGYDSWAQHAFGGELAGEYNGWAKKLGNLNVGDRLTWKGAQSRGTLTVVSEAPVEGFRCKQLTYRLDKGSTSAERPGLVCWGRLNEYSGSDSWVEVY